MKSQLITLEALLTDVRTLSREAFLQKHDGTFLLAVGYLAVEEIKRRFRKGDEAEQLTTAVAVGKLRHHSQDEAHPLAGRAFFLKWSEPQAARAASIGRSPECQITIPDESVSQFHCQLQALPGGLHVIDVGSTNGTSVNLEPLEMGVPRPLEDEYILSVGRYSFQFLTARSLYNDLTLLEAMDRFDEDVSSEE